MPIIKSAKKRVRKSRGAAVRNARTRRSMREALKALQAAIEAGDTKKIAAAGRQAQSTIDIALKKGLIHKNKAARQKARLSAQTKAAGAKAVKPTAAKQSIAKAKKTSSAKSAS